MLSYSPECTLHPQVIHVYTIEFSTGLNSLKYSKLIEETINKLLLTFLTASTASAQ